MIYRVEALYEIAEVAIQSILRYFTRAYREQGSAKLVLIYTRAPPSGITKDRYRKHYNTPPPLNSNIPRIQINLLN